MQRAGNRTALAPREHKAPRPTPDPVAAAAGLPTASRLDRAVELLGDRRTQSRLAGLAIATAALQQGAHDAAAVAAHTDALLAAVTSGVHSHEKREAAAARIAADSGQQIEAAIDRSTTNYAPVKLLGNSASLELETPLFYDFTFSNVKIDNKATSYTITGGTFEAPWDPDTIIDLLDWMPLPSGPNATGIIRGPEGPAGPPGEPLESLAA
jgi:hypothetical protein